MGLLYVSFFIYYLFFKQNVVNNNHCVANVDLCINHMSGTFFSGNLIGIARESGNY